VEGEPANGRGPRVDAARDRPGRLPAARPFAVGQGAIAPVVVITATDLGASPAIGLLVVATAGLGQVIADIPAAALVHRFGERPTMLGAAALTALAQLGGMLAPSLTVFATAIFLTGAGTAVWLLARQAYVTEFVPLGFVHQNTLLFQQGLARTGPTLAEHLKIHALARVLLAGSIHNIQVSWVKLNRKLSQLCLHAGANDYGGTLMEENISREAGATAGQYTSPEDFQTLILEIGRIPAERNTKYSQIKIKLPVESLSSEVLCEPALLPEFA